MKRFRADLHVHSVLSPCGDIDMSPVNIIRQAKACGIDILAMTDHNSTLHCKVMMELGKEEGILIIPGAEVNTREEIHCLTLFENIEQTEEFQRFLYRKLSDTPNKPSLFGEQLLVDRDERILEQINPLLIAALSASIYEVRDEVERIGGIIIPAHIDRPYNSIISQLGFIPSDLNPIALEVSARESIGKYRLVNPSLKDYAIITNSDGHTIESLGQATTLYQLEEACFKELLMALRNENGRKILVG